MDAIKKAWKGTENLALVFWGYFIFDQLSISILAGTIGAIGRISGNSRIAATLIIIIVMPFIIWVYRSLWKCAFNVKWKP